MKKILFIVMCMLMALTLTSCFNAKKQLIAQIEEANDECPISCGALGEMTSVEYKESTEEVVLTIDISKDFPVNISALNQVKNSLKRSIISGIAESDESMALIKEIAKADSKLTIVMRDAANESVKFKLSKSEVKELADGNIDEVTPREMLETTIQAANVQCPMQVDEATVLTSATIEGNNVVYNYSLDEEYVSIEAMEENETSAKAQIKQSLRSNDPSIKSLIKQCKDANAGIVYRYTGNITGEVLTISFSASEL